MKRYPHYWWPTKGARYPSRIAVLDCDGSSAPWNGMPGAQREHMAVWCLSWVTLRSGVVVRSSHDAGDTPDSLARCIRHMLSSNDNTWLFASPTDRILPMIGFWDALEAGPYYLDGIDWRSPTDRDGSGDDSGDGCCIIESPPTVIVCRRHDAAGKLVILDIRNWGIDLLPHDWSAHERVKEYIGGICEIVPTLRASGTVSLRCTAGSQGMSALRARPDCVRLHCHTHARGLLLERAAYVGGRCECFRLGDIPGPVYHVDVRSMYPSICASESIPVSLRRYHADPGRATAAVRDCVPNCIADVSLRCGLPIYPYRRGGDTIYPTGRIRSVLCGPELAAAAEAGQIEKVHSAAEYTLAPLLSPLYRDWLAMLATAREHGQPIVVQWLKRVMNSLAGKFGEPGRRWVASRQRPEQGPYGQWYETGPDGALQRYRNIAWHTQREEVNGESYWSCPAIAGFITSHGRRRLWGYIATAGRENVWYCDTDSLLCNASAYDRLLSAGHIRDGETGYLRLLGTHQRCIVYGIRHYELDDTVSCAGIPRGAIRPGETRDHYWWRISAKAEIAMGESPTGVELHLPLPGYELYRHGIVGRDGTITPLEVNDG